VGTSNRKSTSERAGIQIVGREKGEVKGSGAPPPGKPRIQQNSTSGKTDAESPWGTQTAVHERNSGRGGKKTAEGKSSRREPPQSSLERSTKGASEDPGGRERGIREKSNGRTRTNSGDVLGG